MNPRLKNLHERLDLGRLRIDRLPSREPVEKRAIAARHRGDVFGLLLPALDLEAADARVGEVGEVVVRREILARDQIAAIELGSSSRVGEDVILPARLRA